MPTFDYKVRSQTGELITGIAEGADEASVASDLFLKGYIPVKIKKKELKTTSGVSLFGRVKDEDIIVFSRQMATLIKAGISFMRSMETLKEQTKSRKLKSAIEDIKKGVEGGISFSEAISKFPKIFSPLYVSMIKVGEESGVLDDILERLASLLEHERTTKARIKAAVRYPMFILSALIAAFFILTTVVIPRFAALYRSAHAVLPFPTRVLVFLNWAVTGYWWLIAAVIAGMIFLIKGYIKTPPGRWNLDKLKLKFPIIGPIVEKTVLSRFARVFATLYRSGIPMLHSLEIVSGTAGNVIISRAVDIIKDDVKEGKGLAEPMLKSGAFPPMVIQMVAVGEETGGLDEMLTKVSDYYDLEAEYAIKNLSTTIEPVLIVLLAGAVLFLALGVFLPIWDMIGALKK